MSDTNPTTPALTWQQKRAAVNCAAVVADEVVGHLATLQAASLRIADSAAALLSGHSVCRHCGLRIERWDDPWAVIAYAAPHGLSEAWVHVDLVDVDCSGAYCPGGCDEQPAEPSALPVTPGASPIEARR